MLLSQVFSRVAGMEFRMSVFLYETISFIRVNIKYFVFYSIKLLFSWSVDIDILHNIPTFLEF